MPFPYRPFLDRKIDLEALRQHFPHEFTEQDPPDYLDVIMGFLLTSKILFIPKTREMMTFLAGNRVYHLALPVL